MCDNDHTDAEIARREHEYEMGYPESEDVRWDRWTADVHDMLVKRGWTTEAQGLDGDQSVDGFSYDFAYDDFSDDFSPAEYIERVEANRRELGLL